MECFYPCDLRNSSQGLEETRAQEKVRRRERRPQVTKQISWEATSTGCVDAECRSHQNIPSTSCPDPDVWSMHQPFLGPSLPSPGYQKLVLAKTPKGI